MKIPFFKKGDSADSDKSQVTFGIFDLFKKIGRLFDPAPQKEKVLRHEDFNAVGDVYFANVSVAYKITQRLLILLLVFFLVFSLITNFKEITYDNFFYLIKDFSSAVDLESSNYDTVSYNSDQRHFFALFRGGLTVVNPSKISAFTATGRLTLQTTSQFSSPCVKTSDKYFVVYDTAGTTFSVYNSFSRIYSETFEYPVTDACFSDNGYMAIITRDISHKSMVHIYNKSFNRLFTVPSNKYAFNIAMDDNKIAICYYDIGDGSGKTDISIRTYDKMTEIASISVDGEFVLSSGFLSDNRYAVITDHSIRIYDKNYEEINSYEYSSSTVTGFDMNDFGVAVSYTENSKNTVIVFDKSGNLLYNEAISENINDISVYEQYIFFRTDTGVIRLDALTQSEQFLPSDQGKMLIYSSNTALVCGDSKAEYLVFNNK